ncbi:hypothetical protein N7448_003733 [Penicillium atrosanguineum]|uniref:Uncharacterized protein n=1 Tax=Penicillium atrosanguineum TaxID=1132637 RepID=A0A9W9PZS9_9EURO|nr:uncharacterized protein N7443_002702 [Penicillium atrosanguineum]KAJ5122599.1 hypothetical protein N7526_009536 [Penicillium atrosanguineum]KAJ5140325.1 hypothetical protein N7448_003733 [Penicillium atrosanguineum]KAJ5310241.1 hypothetical protein N7443_002702 [Penicillium atrosanguineum]KAJ5315757.1 hypothetical protein N7476_006064 [Penicillium atrosanguineum]
MALQRTKTGTGCSAFDLGDMEMMGVQEIFLFYPSFVVLYSKRLVTHYVFESIDGGSYMSGDVRTAG